MTAPEPPVTADRTPERRSAEHEFERRASKVHDYEGNLTGYAIDADDWREVRAILAAHLADVEARLAAVWDEGAERGFDSHAPEDLTDVQAGNPYRAALHPDPSEPADA